jgi:hypothetical protein
MMNRDALSMKKKRHAEGEQALCARGMSFFFSTDNLKSGSALGIGTASVVVITEQVRRQAGLSERSGGY